MKKKITPKPRSAPKPASKSTPHKVGKFSQVINESKGPSGSKKK